MPELPEVESIKLQLREFLIGHSIEKVDIRIRKLLPEGENNIRKSPITNVRRFGKVLVIDFKNGYSLVIHIKLTGQLVYRGPNLPKPPQLSPKVIDRLGGRHTHVVFTLDKEGMLYYNDLRRFGWMKVVKTKDVEDIDFIKKLGPEPLDGLTEKLFFDILQSTRRAVKVVIMDQSKMGGVGNIYANDALYLAQIHPERAANSLEKKEADTLLKAIETVLKKGLKTGGASELAFVRPDGTTGEYQLHTLVYGKEGRTCSKHPDTKIQKKMVSGRGTYFCPECQKK